MDNIEVGQIWKSKHRYSEDVGYYVVKVLRVYSDPNFGTLVDVEFMGTEWKDGHWSTDTTNAKTLLEGYELQ